MPKQRRGREEDLAVLMPRESTTALMAAYMYTYTCICISIYVYVHILVRKGFSEQSLLAPLKRPWACASLVTHGSMDCSKDLQVH